MTFLYRKMYEGASPASLAPLSLLERMRMRRTESFDLEEAVPASTEAYTTQPVTTAPAGIIQETTAPLDSSLDWPSSPLQDVESDCYEERAAIIQYCGGVPREQAEILARLCAMPRPPDITHQRWLEIIDAAAMDADKMKCQRKMP